MEKKLDRITETYFGDYREKFKEQVQERIHWICENATGENILDVGCSQGITSIILGREGKKVIGIDLQKESIDYAKNMLKNESEITQKYVDFRIANFIDCDYETRKFDTIIFGDILEHITDSKRFMKKASTLISGQGKVIVTVPFGVTDNVDHKKTYYLLDLINLAEGDLEVKDIKFFGKWVGAIFSKRAQREDSVSLSSDLLRQLESSFYKNEKELLREIKYTKNQLKDILEMRENVQKKIIELEHENTALKKKYSETLEDLEKKQLVQENELKEQLLKCKELLLKAEQNCVNSDEELLDAYNREEKLLINYKNLLTKYEALCNSKLGKLTLSYWRWKNKRRK